MQAPEEFAWEVLASDDFVLTPHEVLTDLIRARDAEVAEQVRAEMLAGFEVETRALAHSVHGVVLGRRLISPWTQVEP